MGKKPYYYTRDCAICGASFSSTNRLHPTCSRKCGVVWRLNALYARQMADGSIRVDANGCWTWTKQLNATGYGPYRRFYQRFKGAIPEGLHIDHTCRNRACCNPDHMEPVTQRENTLRGIAPPAANARKTHCKFGHEFTPENTYRPLAGGRACRECKRIYFRRYRVEKSAILRARARERQARHRETRLAASRSYYRRQRAALVHDARCVVCGKAFLAESGKTCSRSCRRRLGHR